MGVSNAGGGKNSTRSSLAKGRKAGWRKIKGVVDRSMTKCRPKCSKKHGERLEREKKGIPEIHSDDQGGDKRAIIKGSTESKSDIW